MERESRVISREDFGRMEEGFHGQQEEARHQLEKNIQEKESSSSGSEENSQGMPGGGGSEMPDMSEFGGEAPGDMGGQFGGRE